MLSQLIGGSTYDILSVILAIPCIMIALSFHEAAHGYAAYKMGDPTARNLGRLTLNPLKHLDLIGSLCMLVCGFGWAKPVPINTRYFKDQKKGMALTALAGPLSNFALGLIGVIITRIVVLIFVSTDNMANINGILYYTSKASYPFCAAVMMLLQCFSYLNFSLAIFNLIPVPPFDGSRILFTFLPDKYYFGIMRYEQYILIGVLLLLSFGPSFLSISSITARLIDGIELILDLILPIK